LSRGITDQLGKSLETRPFAVQRPATLQDRHRNPVRKEILLDAIPDTHRLAILADLGVTTPERIKALENAAKARGIMVSTHVANRAVADHYRLNELVSAFHAGANGYFVNVITWDRFIRSIELVMMGETIFPSAFLSFVIDANRPHLVEPAAIGMAGRQEIAPRIIDSGTSLEAAKVFRTTRC
jgi:DNA-binding NarL/FixJ family response regulator